MLKQLLQWLSPKREVVYVPVVGDGTPYLKKWENEQYLGSVVSMAENRVWNTEIVDAVTQIRELADVADSPASLKAYNNTIKVVKNLLIKPEIAKETLKARYYDSTGGDDYSLK